METNWLQHLPFNITSSCLCNVFSSFSDFVYQRQAVPRRIISPLICVWRWTANPVISRWVQAVYQSISSYVLCISPPVTQSQGHWRFAFCLQGYLPPTKNGVEPKRPSRPINITSLVRLSTTVPNTIVVSWTSEIGRVRRSRQSFISPLKENISHVSVTCFAHYFYLLLSEFFHGCLSCKTAVVCSVVTKTTGQRNQEPWPLKGSE